ncbi:uncharacterized protein F5Z01DRAFT_735078 [Emericellopsis atlantica]|uniref:HTH myb-type domain-containing protein n=1 Tax=Emericellopsis atlantica TaxID=2614577 RepID=A0A9P8CQX6_9HYPO|nr:uncharacterized protein F5Z01DRAFT_735078 [Emericellopsis atlantica]KAG9256409.1 hypothetical protein F5Z01DRAFT_735078 [Emericellopsis atlantica]
MDEAAPAQPSAAAPAAAAAVAAATTNIKQEPHPVDHFDFSVPDAGTKRPMEEDAQQTALEDAQRAKRLKAEHSPQQSIVVLQDAVGAEQPSSNHAKLEAAPANSAAEATAAPSPTSLAATATATALQQVFDAPNLTNGAIHLPAQEHPMPHESCATSPHAYADDDDDADAGDFDQAHALSSIEDILQQFQNDSGGDALINGYSDDGFGLGAGHQQLAPINFHAEPERFAQNQCLQPLGHLALMMLLILTHRPFDELSATLRDPESQQCCRYRHLQKSLEALRGTYTASPVLLVELYHLDSRDAGKIFQFANLAQLAAWLIEGTPESLRQASEQLPLIFRDEILGFPKAVAKVMVGLKTQRAIQTLQLKEDQTLSEDELHAIYLEGVEDLLNENNIMDGLSNGDSTVTNMLRKRMDDVRQSLPATDLAEKYPIRDILKDYSHYVNNQLEASRELGEKFGFTMPEYEQEEMDTHDLAALEMEMQAMFDRAADNLVDEPLASTEGENQEAPPQQTEQQASEAVNGTANSEEPKSNTGSLDLAALEALVAESTSEYVKTTLQGMSANPYQPTVPMSTAESMAAQAQFLSTQQQQQQQHQQQQNQQQQNQQQQQHQQQQQQHHQQQQQLQQQQQQLQQQHHQQQTQHHQPQQQQLHHQQAQQPQQPQPQPQAHAQQQSHQHPQQQTQSQPTYYASFPQASREQQPLPQQTVDANGLPPNQTHSSAVLYEMARQSALSRVSNPARREGVHSARRPWSQEEEKALMEGLDRVKGPHWSQILGLYGAHGTISDVLKDRTQVQLKDKARNLKLFFLKTNSEMPFYLNTVTGELKTRAPTQAARKEAEEKARRTSEEVPSRPNGNLQSPTQHSVNGSAGAGMVTPAQAAAAAHLAAATGSSRPPSQVPQTTTTSTATAANAAPQTAQRTQTQLPPQVPRPQPQAPGQHSNQTAVQVQLPQTAHQHVGPYGHQPLVQQPPQSRPTTQHSHTTPAQQASRPQQTPPLPQTGVPGATYPSPPRATAPSSANNSAPGSAHQSPGPGAQPALSTARQAGGQAQQPPVASGAQHATQGQGTTTPSQPPVLQSQQPQQEASQRPQVSQVQQSPAATTTHVPHTPRQPTLPQPAAATTTASTSNPAPLPSPQAAAPNAAPEVTTAPQPEASSLPAAAAEREPSPGMEFEFDFASLEQAIANELKAESNDLLQAMT